MLFTTLMVFAPGCRLDVEDNRRGAVHPGGLAVVFNSVHHICHVLHQDRCVVFPGNRNVCVIARDGNLVVGVDLIILARAVKVSLRGIHAGLRQCGANVFHVDAVGRERNRD